MELLFRLDAEVVIGQLRYKQRADIHNHVHNYSAELHLAAEYVRF